MTAIAANLRPPVALPESVAKPPVRANAQPSHDDHFSHVLSQKHSDGGDRIPMPKAAPGAKVAETVAKKEQPANDTLQLVNNSHAVLPTATAPPQPVNTTTPTDTSIDDVLAKTPSSPPVAAPAQPAPVLATMDAAAVVTAATGEDAANVPTIQNSAAPDAKTATTANASVVPLRTPPPGVSPAPIDAATTLAAAPHTSDTPAFKPVASRHDATPESQVAIPLSMTPIKPEVVAPTSTAASVVNAQVGATPAAVLKQPDIPQKNATEIALPLTTDAANTIAPIAAAVIASASSHHVDAKDNSSDDGIDDITSTDSSVAVSASPLSIAEHRDFAALDGKIPVPSPGSTEFADALGERMSWMAERHIGHAEIHLTPDGMGPVDVRVHMDGNHIRAAFGSNNADVRQAITDHLPRLRDMLSQHGFSLSDTHVGGGSQQQTSAPSRFDDVAIAPIDDTTGPSQPARAGATHAGILDEFA